MLRAIRRVSAKANIQQQEIEQPECRDLQLCVHATGVRTHTNATKIIFKIGFPTFRFCKAAWFVFKPQPHVAFLKCNLFTFTYVRRLRSQHLHFSLFDLVFSKHNIFIDLPTRRLDLVPGTKFSAGHKATKPPNNIRYYRAVY